MMSWLLSLHKFERRLAALGWVLRLLLSKTFTGHAKCPKQTKLVVLLMHFVRLSLAQRLHLSP